MWQKFSFLFDSKYEMDTVDGQTLFKIGCAFQSAMVDFLADYAIPTCKASENETTRNLNVKESSTEILASRSFVKSPVLQKYMTLLLRNVVASLKENFGRYEE